MKIILRDDDTCYFTKPAELEQAFGDIWSFAPISLAVIPFVGKSLRNVVPGKYWHSEKKFPIGGNKELVDHIKKLIQENKVCLMLHGHSHEDYPSGYEFVAGKDLAEKTKEGKKYLEDLFDTEITAFVPPHNTFSQKGWNAVISNGLNISGIPNFHHYGRLKHPSYWLPFLKKVWYKPRTHYTCPYSMHFNGHEEVPYFSFCNENQLSHLKKAYDAVHKKNGVLCIATHYWSLLNSPASKNILINFIKEAKKTPDIEFLTFNEFLSAVCKNPQT